MNCPVRVIPASSSEWNSWLERVTTDFPHTAAYHQLSQDCGEGRAFLAVCGTADRFLAWPYLLRRVDEVPALEGSNACDITSVYGYPGPLALGCSPGDAFLGDAWRALNEVWREQKAVCAFTRFNPLLANHRWLPASGETSSGCGLGVRLSGRTVSIDLQRSDEEIWKDYKRQLRQHIHRGRQAGLATEIDESWSSLDDFVRIYTMTMTRNCAERRYFFSGDYFRRLRRALGSSAFLAVTRFGDRVAAAGFIVEYGGVVNPHLAGSDDEFLHLSPFKVFVDDLRLWGQQRGNHTLHMGGGRGGSGDSLFRFKSQFSPRCHEFYTGRWILDQQAYVWLCDRQRRCCAESGFQAEQSGFFPAYRAPAQPAAPEGQAVAAEVAGA